MLIQGNRKIVYELETMIQIFGTLLGYTESNKYEKRKPKSLRVGKNSKQI